MRHALLAAVFLSLAAPARADDIAGSDIASGNWIGAGETGSDGRFLDCYVSVGYVNGEELWVSLYDDDSLTLFLTQPGASFVPGRNYDASLMTEVGYPIHGTAFAADTNYIAFTLAGLDDSIDWLTQGSYLRLLGVGIDQSFDVRGLGGALAQARACLVKHGGSGTMASAPPVTSTPGGTPVLGVGDGSGAKPIQMSKPVRAAGPPRTRAM
jgi:hypothetical protein